MSNLKMLYSDDASWEREYIQKEIFGFASDLEVEDFSQSELSRNFSPFRSPSILVFSRKSNPPEELVRKWKNEKTVVVVATKSADYPAIRALVETLRPAILLITSDEKGNYGNWNEMGKYTRLIFRQYNHKHYHYAPNSFQIPLGYVSKFLDNAEKAEKGKAENARKCLEQENARKYLEAENARKHIVQPIHSRNLHCAFVGEMKGDRDAMKIYFEKTMNKCEFRFVHNTWNPNRLPVSPTETWNLYHNAIFVPVGRGYASLDCFRVYEAIVAGAIPVIAGGKEEEILSTFFFGGIHPPFLYAETWEKASEMCKELVEKDPVMLQSIQNELLQWWDDQMDYLQRLARKSLSV